MKKSLIFCLTFFCSLIVISCTQGKKLKKQKPMAEQTVDTVSYSLGVLIGQNIQSQGFDNLDVQAFSEAIKNVLDSADLKISAEKAQQVIEEYSQKNAAKMIEKSTAEGKAFLEENKKRPEVTVTESGLQYEVLTKGTGPVPQATDEVIAHYEGKLLNGKVFDSSIQRGTPAEFPVNRLIPGWVEALQIMPVGSKWRLYIPYNLAYGERGAGNDIPPYATLIFDLELIAIK